MHSRRSSRLSRERNAFDKVTDARPCLRVIIASVERVFCCITYPDRTGYATMGTSVFDAAANALEWVEAHRRDFGTARRFNDDEILRIGVGMAPDRWYRVRIRRVRQWEAERRDASRQETLGRVRAPPVEVPARCRPQDYLEGKVINREIGKFRCKPSQIFYVVGNWLDSVRYRHQNATIRCSSRQRNLS